MGEAGSSTITESGTEPGSIPELAHGGRLLAARRAFPEAPAPFLDLSTGISPFAYPFAMPPATCFARLPEPEQELSLRDVAASTYAAPGAQHVAIAPGSQMLIALLPRLLDCRRAAVLGPTYAEHAASWRRHRVPVIEPGSVAALFDAVAADTALVLCNPNNPDGARIDAATLAALSERTASAGGWLVVDEAYADLERDMVPAATLLAGNGRVVVLRSFGKSYGLAGIRLGFLLASPPVAAAAAALLGPWPVGGLALAAGRQALSDRAWRRRTAVRVTQASARLDAVLRAAGLTIRGGTGLFRLADTEAAGSLWRRLAQHGILVRRFDDHPSWLRFGLPADEPAWDRLERFFSADRA